jgi:hypothetical protein
MKMRTAQWLAIGSMVAVGFLGCSPRSEDSSRVIVNVAGESITEAQFETVVRILVGDQNQADQLLKNETMKEQRNQILDSMALQKAIIQMARAEGLEKETEVKFVLEQTTAQLFLKTLMERRIAKAGLMAEPSEAELRALYEAGIAQQKAAGQTKDLPTYEQVRPQIMDGLLQRQRQEKNESELKALIADLRQKYPMTYAEGYKPTPQPGQP